MPDIAVVREFQTLRRYVPLLRLLWQIQAEGVYSGVTYHGYAISVGRDTRSEWVRRVIHQARNAGWVEIHKTGVGRGARAIVRLTDDGGVLCRRLFEQGEHHGE